MDIVGKARKLERKIARSLDAALGEMVGSATTAALEIVHEVLDRAEQQIEHAGRGRRIFPFTRIVVMVPVGRDRHAKARFAAVVEGPPSLAERLRARLERSGCNVPQLTVDVAYAAKPGQHWTTPALHVEFLREEVPATSASPAAEKVEAPPLRPPRLKLSVVKGTGSQRHYLFTGNRIDMGRRAEVLDAKQRLVRTNHVAFEENADDVNASVSRRHAHIEYDADTRTYRLLDDRSAHGTGIVRGGRTIPVLAGSRGARLQHGDEIVLGQARLRVTLDS